MEGKTRGGYANQSMASRFTLTDQTNGALVGDGSGRYKREQWFFSTEARFGRSFRADGINQGLVIFPFGVVAADWIKQRNRVDVRSLQAARGGLQGAHIDAVPLLDPVGRDHAERKDHQPLVDAVGTEAAAEAGLGGEEPLLALVAARAVAHQGAVGLVGQREARGHALVGIAGLAVALHGEPAGAVRAPARSLVEAMGDIGQPAALACARAVLGRYRVAQRRARGVERSAPAHQAAQLGRFRRDEARARSRAQVELALYAEGQRVLGDRKSVV